MRSQLFIFFFIVLTITSQNRLIVNFHVFNKYTNEDVSGLVLKAEREYKDGFLEEIGRATSDVSGNGSIDKIITGVSETMNVSPVNYGVQKPIFGGKSNLGDSDGITFVSDKAQKITLFTTNTNGEEISRWNIDVNPGTNRILIPSAQANIPIIAYVASSKGVEAQKLYGTKGLFKPSVNMIETNYSNAPFLPKVSVEDSVKILYTMSKDGFKDSSWYSTYPTGQDVVEDFELGADKIPLEQRLELAFINTTGDPVLNNIYASWNNNEVTLNNLNGAIDEVLKNYHNEPDSLIRLSFDKGSEYLHEMMIRAIGSGFINGNIVQNNTEKDSNGRPYVDITLNNLNEALYVITTNKGGTLPDGRYLEFTSQEARELWGQRLPLPDFTNHKFVPSPNGNYIGEVAIFIDTENATQQDLNNMVTVFEQQTSVMQIGTDKLVTYTEPIYINGAQDPVLQEWIQEKNSNFYILNFKGQGGNSASYNTADGSIRRLTVSMFSGASIAQISGEFSEATGLLDEPSGYGTSISFVEDAPNNEFYKRLINHIYLKDNKTFRFNDTRME